MTTTTNISNLTAMSTSALVTLHNDNNAAKPIKAWKGKRQELIDRVVKLISREQKPTDIEVKIVVSDKAGKKVNARNRGIGEYCREQLLVIKGKTEDGHPMGLSYESILKAAQKRFPESAVNRGHLRWYSSRMRENGIEVPSYREKSDWKQKAA